MDSGLACSDFRIMRRHTYTNANTYTYTNSYTNSYTDPNTNTDTDTYSNTNANSDTNRIKNPRIGRLSARKFCEWFRLYSYG